MMNGVALLLILACGCVWSPKLSQSNQDSNYMVKRGHSVVVVEYGGEGKEGKTKVSIYPKDYFDGSERVGEAKEFVSENVGTVKDFVGEGSSKIMDGFHKVKEVVGGGSSKLKEGAHEVKEVVGEGSSKLKEEAHEVKEIVGEGSTKVKDGAHKIQEVLDEGSSKVRDGAYKVKELVDEGRWKVKYVKYAAHKVIESDTMEIPKRALKDIKSNLSNLADIDRTDVEEFVCDVFGKCKQGLEKAEGATKEGVEKAEGATKEGVSKGVGKMKEVVADGSSKVKYVTEKVKDSVMIGDTIEAPQMNSLMGVVQLLAFSMSFGMSMWMTFVSCHILSDALPREQFGMLQSRLYPFYYKIQAYCIGVALMAHLFSRGKKIVSSSAEIFYTISLVMSLLMSFGNFLYLEPKATQIMSERFKVEKEEGREEVTCHPRSGIADDAGDPVSATTKKQGEVRAETHTARLSEKLQMINQISSYANIVTLISLSMHMVYLGLQIQ